MGIRQLVAATLQAGFIFAAQEAAHAGTFGKDSDILGLNLTMSRDEASASIEHNFPGAAATPLSANIKMQGSQKEIAVGVMVDLVTKESPPATQEEADQRRAFQEAQKALFGDSPMNLKVGKIGDFAQDRVKVLFNPNDGASDIFGISRYTEYATGNQPVTKTVIGALTEKYGQPSRSGGDNRTLITYTWAAPGVIERTRSSQTHCYEDAGFDFLYENIGEGGFYGARQMVNSTGEGFVRTVNLVLSKNPMRNYAICGTVLQVRLKLTSNGDYVGAMGARLLDLTKAYSELGQFGASFMGQVQGQRQQQLNRDQNNKPRL